MDEIPADVLEELIEGCMVEEQKLERMKVRNEMMDEQREINELEIDVARSLHRDMQKEIQEENNRVKELLASHLSMMEQKNENEEALRSEVCHMKKELEKEQKEHEASLKKQQNQHEESMKIMKDKWQKELMLHGSKEEWSNEIEKHKKKLERTEKALKGKTDALIKHLARDKVETVKKIKSPRGYKARTTF